jgi:uncharacterized protein YndB with AHSA1/START domain
MTEIGWERELPAPPEIAWSYLVDPEKMSRWSRARITCVDKGDGGVSHAAATS